VALAPVPQMEEKKYGRSLHDQVKRKQGSVLKSHFFLLCV